MCETGHWDIPLDEFKKAEAELKGSLEEHGYNETLKSYTTTYDGNDVDASLLMLALMDFDPDSSKRLFSTVMKIKEDLSVNSLVYRYRSRDDGLACGEGAFGACSFWLVDALARFGLTTEAADRFHALLKNRNSVGLWPEEISPENKEFLGNYPQTFTHTAIIGAALSLKRGSSHERQ
jgi:GH15 family glucan-1,4-alpha-glucosidase